MSSLLVLIIFLICASEHSSLPHLLGESDGSLSVLVQMSVTIEPQNVKYQFLALNYKSWQSRRKTKRNEYTFEMRLFLFLE